MIVWIWLTFALASAGIDLFLGQDTATFTMGAIVMSAIYSQGIETRQVIGGGDVE